MKKACIIFVLSLLSNYLFAQDVEIGIKINPNVSFNRITEEVKNGDFEKNGAKLNFAIGPIVDIHLTPNICFSTGVFFATKGVKYTASINDDNGEALIRTNANVDLQYLQLPIGLKLFTGEIASNTKLYFELGGLFDAKIAEKYDKESSFSNESGTYTAEDMDKTFAKFLDVEINLTIGTEIEVGSNKAYFGVNYNRGLVNVLHNDFKSFSDKKEVKINTDVIGLVLGFKF